MTITLTLEHIYILIIVVLGILQVIQWRFILKLKKECEQLWEQIGLLAAGITNQVISLQKELNQKVDK
jgi:hypothetical protein